MRVLCSFLGGGRHLHVHNMTTVAAEFMQEVLELTITLRSTTTLYFIKY